MGCHDRARVRAMVLALSLFKVCPRTGLSSPYLSQTPLPCCNPTLLHGCQGKPIPRELGVRWGKVELLAWYYGDAYIHIHSHMHANTPKHEYIHIHWLLSIHTYAFTCTHM